MSVFATLRVSPQQRFECRGIVFLRCFRCHNGHASCCGAAGEWIGDRNAHRLARLLHRVREDRGRRCLSYQRRFLPFPLVALFTRLDVTLRLLGLLLRGLPSL